MSVSAYVLIQTELGRAAEVAQAAGEVPGVIAADDVTGPYDVICRVTANDIDELGRLVVSRVQDVGGIVRTLTCPVVAIG